MTKLRQDCISDFWGSKFHAAKVAADAREERIKWHTFGNRFPRIV